LSSVCHKNILIAGIVSNDGQYPSAHSDDQDQLLAIGPMCRYAQDMRLTLKILANKNSDLLKLDQKVDMSKIKASY
jgi:fatty acid amide hydrolase 2